MRGVQTLHPGQNGEGDGSMQSRRRFDQPKRLVHRLHAQIGRLFVIDGDDSQREIAGRALPDNAISRAAIHQRLR